jgi:hypothetical protein
MRPGDSGGDPVRQEVASPLNPSLLLFGLVMRAGGTLAPAKSELTSPINPSLLLFGLVMRAGGTLAPAKSELALCCF